MSAQDPTSIDFLERVSIRRVATFIAVAEALSVTEVARRLNVKQPAVTQQIKALEDALGLRLFARSGRELVLTDNGSRILPIARRLLTQHQRAIADMQEVLRAVKRELRVGMSAPQMALPVAHAFTDQFPNVHLSFNVGNTATLVSKIDDLLLDVAFVGMAEPMPRLHCQWLADQHLVLVMRADHPWARRRAIALADLKDARLIMREAGSFTQQLLEQAFERDGVTPERGVQMATREAVQHAAAVGIGVTPALSRELIGIAGLTSAPLEDACGDRIVGPEFVVCRPELAAHPPVSMFLDVCAGCVW